jgi:hypothetical protein
MKIIRQSQVQDQQRHGDAKDGVAQRIEARFGEHGGWKSLNYAV